MEDAVGRQEIEERGFFWCSISCLCELCEFADTWFYRLQFLRIPMFGTAPPEKSEPVGRTW